MKQRSCICFLIGAIVEIANYRLLRQFIDYTELVYFWVKATFP